MNRMIKNMIAKVNGMIQGLRFAVQERGAVAVEFALTLPIWVLLLLGSTDIGRLLLLSQRVDRIAYSVTDIVTQSETISKTDLDHIFLAAGQLMQPYIFAEKGIVIVTSLYKPSGQAVKISWQYSGGGTLPRNSKIGSPSTPSPAIPAGITLNDNENLIISEVFYAYEPLFMYAGILDKEDIYRVAVYKPRLSPLITPPT